MALLDSLNPAQLQAVTSESETILTLAGAGSGKTRVLTHRIGHLVNNRVGTSNMLALTFTRLAAKEMKERLIALIGEDMTKKLFCGTFHSFCVKVLREWGHMVGVEPNFTIYDEEDRKAIIETIISDFKFKNVKVFDVFRYLCQWGKALFMLGDSGKVINEYLYQLKQNNALDMDMLLHKTNDLFNIDMVRSYYRNIYHYVFVDEYQDTSNTQVSIIKSLQPENIFVVGDDFQSIYGWRGANVQNILLFNSSINYPDAETIKLEHNYRSTTQIVEAANNLISYNESQTEKTLITQKEGEPISFATYEDEILEAQGVAEIIRELSFENLFNLYYKDFAILSRTNHQLITAKTVLDRAGIPCQLVNNQGDIFKKTAVREILTYMTAAHNPSDNVAVRKAFRIPEPRATVLDMERWELQALDAELPLMDVFEHSDHSGAQEFTKLINDIRCIMKSDFQDVEHIFQCIIEILGMEKYLSDRGLTNRIEQMDEAYNRILKWQGIQKELGEDYGYDTFLRYLNTRDIQEKLVQEDINAVKLLTVHAAKGLEFPVVFLVGLNQGVFPAGKAEDMEEERRLMYVAITRAKERLHVSNSKVRSQWGGEKVICEPSQFLREIREKRAAAGAAS
jgi:DNA helicase-2/ATP-dependent DNA helicase PcrA